MKICQKYNGTALITGEVYCITTKTKATMSSVNHSRGSCISSHWLVKVLVTMVKMESSDQCTL